MEELHEMTHENTLQIVNHKKTSLVIVKIKKNLLLWLLSLTTTGPKYGTFARS